MSDLLTGFGLSKWKENILVSTEHCLNYMKQDCVAGDEIIFTVNIQNEQLRSWYDLREGQGFLTQFSYVEILNASIAEQSIKIKDDFTRIDGWIRRSCSNIKSKCRKLEGRARVQYLNEFRKIAIRRDEIVKVADTEEKINKMRETAKGLLEDNKKLQKRC